MGEVRQTTWKLPRDEEGGHEVPNPGKVTKTTKLNLLLRCCSGSCHLLSIEIRSYRLLLEVEVRDAIGQVIFLLPAVGTSCGSFEGTADIL